MQNENRLTPEHKVILTEMRQRIGRKREPGIIPKILHQIWSGPSPIPDVYWELRKSFEQTNPDWQVMFWTDKEIDALDLSTRKWYEKYPQKPIIKVDMAKFEIPYRFGGVYADHDTLFLKSFTPLTRHSFFTTVGIPGAELEAMNFIYGCEQHSPIMKHLMSRIDDSSFDPDGDFISYFRTFSSYYFNRIVQERLPHELEAVMYPEEYFAPFPSSARGELDVGGVPAALKYAEEDTYSIHLWTVSWRNQFK